MKKKLLSITIGIALFSVFNSYAQIKMKYTYDKVNQLVGYEHTGSYTNAFIYDQTGNRLKKNQEFLSLDIQENSRIKATLYPNPFGGTSFYIRFDENVKPGSVTLHNIAGRQLPIRTNFTENVVEVRVSDLAPGVYFCRIEVDGQYFHVKVVKKPDL